MQFNPDDPKWTAYVLGELSATECSELEKELESSVAAREAVDEIRMTTLLLKDELAQEASAGLLAEQHRNIRVQATAKTSWGFRQLVFAGAAACLMVGMIAAPWVIRSQRGIDPINTVELEQASANGQAPEVGAVEPYSQVSPQVQNTKPTLSSPAIQGSSRTKRERHYPASKSRSRTPAQVTRKRSLRMTPGRMRCLT